MQHTALGMTLGLLLLATAADAQNFLQPTVIPTGNWPAAVYTADVNADGIPDLIYIDQGATQNVSTTHVLLGNGMGGFTQSAVLATAGTSLALGDLSGHGMVDIGWLSAQSTTQGNTTQNVITYSIAPNAGAGTFSTTLTRTISDSVLPKPVKFGYLLAARIRSSGPLDLLAGDITSGSVFDFQYSTITPYSDYQVTSPFPGGVGPMTVLDINRDGNPDLIVNGLGNFTAQILFGVIGGLPSGAVSAKVTSITGASGVHSMLLTDMNGDGLPDLVVEGTGGTIEIFLGNGNGTFQTAAWLNGVNGIFNGTIGLDGSLVAAIDVNHDGQPDLLAATPAGISSLLNNAGIFTLKGLYNGGPGRASYAIADFNGDKNLDLAIDSPEGIAILYGDSDGSFQSSQSFYSGQPAMSGALGVLDSTGRVDEVVSTGVSQFQVLEGYGDGTFWLTSLGAASIPSNPVIPNVWSVVQLGDFNGDGWPDIALTQDGAPANFEGGSGIFMEFNDPVSGGAFGEALFVLPLGSYALPTGCTSSRVNYEGTFYGVSVVSDFNGDGIIDIANLDPNATRVMLGVDVRPGFGSLQPTLGFEVGNGPVPDQQTCSLNAHDLIVKGDFNNDGHPDLLVQRNGSLVEYLNDGKGNFTVLGDLHAAGSLVSPGSTLAPDINATFGGPSTALGFPAFPGSAVVADLDRDGNNDLIVTYANLSANLQAPTSTAPNFIYIWFGSGNGHFLTSAKHPVNPVVLTPSRNFYQVAVADVNLDGIPDLILSDGYLLSVQLGRGDGTFGPETHYLAGQGINTISVADVNGDSKPDLVLANGGAVLTNPVANLEVLGTNPDVNTGGITVLVNHANFVQITPNGILTASPEPSTYGNPFTITATLSPVGTAATPTGTVTFTIDRALIGSANLSGGVATVAVPSNIYATLAPGPHSLTATYSGDPTYGPNNNLAGSHTVALLTTSVALLLCVDPPGSNFPCGNPISATPLISPITMFYGQSLDGVAIESADDLNGTLTFYSGTRVFCSLNANLQSGGSMCPPTSGIFPAGTTTVTAAYSGDSVHTPSTSNGIVVTVYSDTTTAAVTSNLNPAIVGQAVTFTANVQGNYAIPEGEPVLFFDGTTLMTTGTLDATGSATFTTASLAVGTHPITVVLPGSNNFNSTTSPVYSQVIEPVSVSVASTVSLVSNINPSAPSQPVTFTATVTVPGAFPTVPSGSVTFLDGTTALATVTLNPATGIASFTTSSLASGSHAMTASYSGAAGTSGVGPVQPPNPPKPPNPHFHPGMEVPSGFRVSGPIAHSELAQPPSLTPSIPPPAAPEATMPQPLAVATPPILASVSPVLTQIVTTAIGEEPAGFVLTVSPTQETLGVGQTAVLTVTIRGVSGFNQPVQLGCTGLPVEATCTFIQPLIPDGGGTTSLYLATSAPRDCGSNTPYFVGSLAETPGRTLAFAMPGLVLMLAGVRRRWRKRANLLGGTILLLSLAAMAAISGCGHCTDLGTRPGTYSFTVTATPQGGPIIQAQSQTITLTVTIP